jgi:glycosyltransferase involved in cell wall biosynthesis
VPRELLTCVPNGIDTERFQRVAPGARAAVRSSLGISQEFVWLAVGRYETAKDYPNLLRAFARIHERHAQAVLWIVGEGSLQQETEDLARALGLGDRVRFLGVRSDVPEVMSAADGYVMSSAWEGMPIVLLEAAAAALPIVSTRVGGNHEVVREGESGFLVPPRDDGSLAAAMLRLMDLPPAEREAMGRRGREHVGMHYGLARVVDRWEDLYRQVSSRKGLDLAPTLSR